MIFIFYCIVILQLDDWLIVNEMDYETLINKVVVTVLLHQEFKTIAMAQITLGQVSHTFIRYFPIFLIDSKEYARFIF